MFIFYYSRNKAQYFLKLIFDIEINFKNVNLTVMETYIVKDACRRGHVQ